jgi:putative ABC transport system permease protein
MMLVGIEGSVAQVQSIVRGVTPSALVVHSGVTMVEGRLPVPGADEVMVGRMVATVMRTDDESVEIGKSILIDGRPWKIVGRFAAPGTVFESEIWTPLTDIKAATRRETISCVVVTLDPAEAELDDIVTFTKMRPDLELSVLSESEYYGQLSAFFAPIRLVAWVTAALISVGGIFGGLNTMYAAFASRVREIGTLQSMGYRRGAILWSLVQESVLATMAGSIAACIIGLVFLDGLSVRFSMGAFGIVIDAFVVGIAMLAGVVVGVIGAVPPAWRCLSMSIPESLKSV